MVKQNIIATRIKKAMVKPSIIIIGINKTTKVKY